MGILPARWIAAILLCLDIFWKVSCQLTKEELTHIFGEREIYPEYSIFNPVSSNDIPTGRNKRDLEHNENIFRFNALGNNYQFSLYPVEDLLSNNFVVVRRENNELYERNWNYKNCFFQGTEIGNARRRIALVACGKMRGVVKDPLEELVIEPLPAQFRRKRDNSWLETEEQKEYIIYKRISDSKCPSKESSFFEERSPLHSRNSEKVLNYFPYRSAKREFTTKFDSPFEEKSTFSGNTPGILYIETAVYVDSDLLRHMRTNFPSNTEEEVIQVVLAMINAVQLLYNDPSLGHKIKYVLKRLELLYNDPPGLVRQHNIDDFLTKFCNWQDRENPRSDSDPRHWDHALILTGLDLYTVDKNGKINSQVVGLAPVAGMCTRTSSCTVNEGRHFESVYVMGHEIGHNLGMRHDGLQSGNNCDPSSYLMSSTLGSGKVTWSRCSRRYLEIFLNDPQSTCLRDTPGKPSKRIDHEDTLLPGQRFSADDQCMLKYGKGSVALKKQPIDEICKDLHCVHDQFTWTSHPALEGTPCGHRKFCRRGQCIDNGNFSNLKSSSSSISGTFPKRSTDIINPWNQWTSCHSFCLYGMNGILSSGSVGISKSLSECRICPDKMKYKACSSELQCNRQRKKTLQDYADDICSKVARKNTAMTAYSVRIPMEGIRRCEIKCLSLDRRVLDTDHYFPDGTICHSPYTEYPTYCIDGFCTEFRCGEEALFDAGPNFCFSSSKPLPGPFPPPLASPDRTRISSSGNLFSDRLPSLSYLETKWGQWVPTSDCRGSCISTAKGIQLVSRACPRGGKCHGLDKNIQICNVKLSQCDRVITPFEHASQICREYSKEIKQLSGLGMQLSSTSDDPDRGCIIACQDGNLEYRFYRVNGRDGWFPFGTECSQNLNGFRSYCLNGKCLEFTVDGIPVRKKSTSRQDRSLSFTNDVTFLEQFDDVFQSKSSRDKSSNRRRVIQDIIDIPKREKRNVKPVFQRIPGSFRDEFWHSFMKEINTTISSVHSTDRRLIHSPSLDLERPIFHGSAIFKSELHQEYRWVFTKIECSVTCGEGIQKIVAECIDVRDTPAKEELCPDKPSNMMTTKKCIKKNLCITTDLEKETEISVHSLKGNITSRFGQWLIDSINEIRKKIP